MAKKKAVTWTGQAPRKKGERDDSEIRLSSGSGAAPSDDSGPPEVEPKDRGTSDCETTLSWASGQKISKTFEATRGLLHPTTV